jgi:CRP-like cAMP-binding protein/Zn-dependent protease
VWLREFTSPRHQLFTIEGSYVLGLLALILLQVLAISVHEAGHALAIRHYGRRVRQLGFALYYLFPCVYVDSTDMTLASRRQRVVVSLAGPLAGIVVAAACALVAAAAPESLAGTIAFKAATLFVFQFVLNLLPILELDGYHVLIDALDVPLLRQRALGFVRGGLGRKVRRRERWSRAELGLALYGILAIAVSLFTIAFSLWIWESRLQVVARELVRAGPVGLVALALLVIVFVGPLLLALVARVIGLGRTAARAAVARRRQAHENVLAERIALLDRVRFLHGLARPALAAIADHLVEERFAAGDIVVTYGEPGDRFYLVRSGRLEVLTQDGATKGAIVPGEGFGELALLDRIPRTATVRATEPTELWSLDRGHFHRWVAERYEVAGRIRASVDERDTLARLPFFAGLDAMELSRIAARMRTERVAAGDAVFAEGERADRYYVIRSGEAEIRTAAGDARRIGPGEGFGEMGLLYGRPRGATVVAASDLVLATIERSDFAALVRASGETVGEFRARTAHYLGAGLAGAVGGG